MVSSYVETSYAEVALASRPKSYSYEPLADGGLEATATPDPKFRSRMGQHRWGDTKWKHRARGFGVVKSSDVVKPVLSFKRVSKIYDSGAGDRYALREVSFDLSPGQRVAVQGRSGSGKSTLLHIAAGIDLPSEGEVWIEGRNLASLSERDRALLRRDGVGLVCQFFYLLSHLSVAENVGLPELVSGGRPFQFLPRVKALLERVDLADRADDPIHQLSGGEMQRVAICRALLRRPRLLLADEPTGNLDDDNSQQVLQLMLSLAEEEGSTLIYATHSRELATLADQRWHLHSGIMERI